MVQNEDADCGRKIAPVGAVIDRAYKRRYRYTLTFGDLTQGVPKLILQRDARLVSIANDRTLDDRRIDGAVITAGTIGGRLCRWGCL